MPTYQYRVSDGIVVCIQDEPVDGSAPSPLPKRAGCATATVDAIPERPAGDKTSVLRHQEPAGLAWFAPTLTPAQTFAAAVAKGYEVPGVDPKLVLDLSDAAQSRFTSLLLLLNTAVAAGRMTTADAFPITDIGGNPRVFSVANVQTMILGYGEYYAGLFAALHVPPAAPAS